MNSRLFSSLQLSPFVSLNEFSTSTGSRPKGRGFAFVGLCNIGLKFAAAVAFTGVMHAQTNLLFNGGFELNAPSDFYYNNAGGDTGTKFDVPGWEAFAIGDASSWVKVATDTNTLNTDLNLNGTSYSAPFPYLGLAGIKTAVSNRVVVASGAGYYATVTHDNYYASAGISYFIDWFDTSGALLGSSGGPLGDPNGPGTFAPFTQQFTISGVAPASATRAGVRFESSDGDPDYASGATADNFQFSPINLLFNGDLESNKPITFYYDNAGSDTGTKSDVPGWEAFAIGDASSWVKVATDTNTLNTDLNLNGTSYSAPFPYLGLAGIKTAVSNRVVVASGAGYYATVTHDNYYASAGISYFIDWFDAGGALLGSSGGPLGDPNGPGTFAPFTQQFAISGVAPASATRAGVRFESSDGDPDYASGATADNFLLAVQPGLNMRQSGSDVILSWTKGPSFGLEQTGDLSGTPVWTYLGTQNPQTIPMTSSNAFFRLVGP